MKMYSFPAKTSDSFATGTPSVKQNTKLVPEDTANASGFEDVAARNALTEILRAAAPQSLTNPG